MMRIVHTGKTERLSPGTTSALYKLIAVLIAYHPVELKRLFENYSVELAESSEQELTEKLFTAISECNKDFNHDLSNLIFSNCADSTYDQFNIQSLFKKESGNGSDQGQSGSGGIMGGIGNAIGSLGGAFSDIIKGKQAKDQATSQTLQQVYAYKAQVASNEKSKLNTKKALLIGLLVIIGIVLLAAIYQNKQKHET